MYKLVAVDLDGTMLNSYGIVTENTKNVIKKVIEQGTEVIIASGRPIDSIKQIAKEIGSTKYFIAGNGALVYDIQKEEVIYEKYMSKEKVLEIMKSDYILFAKARGEKTSKIVLNHVLKNVSLPAITLQFLSFSELFGGTIFVEQVFSYPGLGQATVSAGLKGDLPLLMGIAIISLVFVYSGNIIADLLYRVIDPRIKEGQNL